MTVIDPGPPGEVILCDCRIHHWGTYSSQLRVISCYLGGCCSHWKIKGNSSRTRMLTVTLCVFSGIVAQSYFCNSPGWFSICSFTHALAVIFTWWKRAGPARTAWFIGYRHICPLPLLLICSYKAVKWSTALDYVADESVYFHQHTVLTQFLSWTNDYLE